MTAAQDAIKLRFQTGMDGEINSIAAPLEPEAPEIIFTRVPDKASQEQK
jgi:hypothetical protein